MLRQSGLLVVFIGVLSCRHLIASPSSPNATNCQSGQQDFENKYAADLAHLMKIWHLQKTRQQNTKLFKAYLHRKYKSSKVNRRKKLAEFRQAFECATHTQLVNVTRHCQKISAVIKDWDKEHPVCGDIIARSTSQETAKCEILSRDSVETKYEADIVKLSKIRRKRKQEQYLLKKKYKRDYLFEVNLFIFKIIHDLSSVRRSTKGVMITRQFMDKYGDDLAEFLRILTIEENQLGASFFAYINSKYTGSKDWMKMHAKGRNTLLFDNWWANLHADWACVAPNGPLYFENKFKTMTKHKYDIIMDKKAVKMAIKDALQIQNISKTIGALDLLHGAMKPKAENCQTTSIDSFNNKYKADLAKFSSIENLGIKRIQKDEKFEAYINEKYNGTNVVAWAANLRGDRRCVRRTEITKVVGRPVTVLKQAPLKVVEALNDVLLTTRTGLEQATEKIKHSVENAMNKARSSVQNLKAIVRRW